VKEIYRVAKLGLRGMELSLLVGHASHVASGVGASCGRPVNDVNLPLHFHTFPALPPNKLDVTTGRTRRAAFFTSGLGLPENLVNILAAGDRRRVLERYPNVRISFGESGIGWIPYALDRMDFEWEDRFRDLGSR
jgi:hypothetical protein